MISLSSFAFGIVFGSFLNVAIYRLKTRQNICFGGSFCPECKTGLKWHDLLPLLSFIFLRGRCRYCRKKISWQYPAVELLSGFLWLAIFYKYKLDGNFQFPISNFQSIFNFQFLNFFYSIFILSVFLVIAVYDFKWRIIPDKIVYTAIGTTVLYNGFLALKFGYWQNYFLNQLLIAVVLFAFLFFIFYFSGGRAMGLGDAKLAFLIGLFLNPLPAIIAFITAFIIGALFGIILLATSRIPGSLVYKGWGMKSQIAFGPFLVLGAAIAFFFSDVINNFIIF